MSIDMEHFGSRDQRAQSAALVDSPPTAFPYRLQCRGCGFESPDAIIAPRRCPKCASSSWERFAYPRSLMTGPGRRTYQRPTRAKPSIDFLRSKPESSVASDATPNGSSL